ncbi:MAG TPA: hypothetical protein VFO90_09460, partial [Terrimicrobiaceae bacterium]|nr:hypothetical protein [Terrimicrobiaceae bacterium]
EHLPSRLGLTVLHAALSAVIGLHLSVWLNCSAAGAMVVAASLLFTAVWATSQIGRHFRRKMPAAQTPGVQVAGAS